MDIAVVSCRSRHALLGKWSAAAMSFVPLTSWAMSLTTEPLSRLTEPLSQMFCKVIKRRHFLS